MVLTGRGLICIRTWSSGPNTPRRGITWMLSSARRDDATRGTWRMGELATPRTSSSPTAPDWLRLDPSPFCLAAACQKQRDWGRGPEELASAPYSKTHFIISSLTARRRAFRVVAAVLLFDEPHHLSGGIGCQSGMSASF